MARINKVLSLILLVACSGDLRAQDYLPASSPWNKPTAQPADQHRAVETVEFQNSQRSIYEQASSTPAESTPEQAPTAQYPAAQYHRNQNVVPVAFETPATTGIAKPAPPEQNTNSRPLPPPSRLEPSQGPRAAIGDLPSISTVAGALGVVFGVFFLLAWTARRLVPGGSAMLPGEAFEVLGRAPLAGRQQVHLLRCGNKLLLVSLASGSAETLTEVTDPVEVERLASLCRGGTAARRATAAFREAIDRVTHQRTTERMPLEDMGADQRISRSSAVAGHESWDEFHA